MTESPFHRVVVPVANRDDAAATAALVVTYVEETDCTVSAVHGIEKAGGVPDNASVEQLEQLVPEHFTTVTEGVDDTEGALGTDLRYDATFAASINSPAHDRSTNENVFTPRGGSRWPKPLTGDVAHNIVRSRPIPETGSPRPNGERSSNETGFWSHEQTANA